MKKNKAKPYCTCKEDQQVGHRHYYMYPTTVVINEGIESCIRCGHSVVFLKDNATLFSVAPKRNEVTEYTEYMDETVKNYLIEEERERLKIKAYKD